jgi:hypothetical protein
MGGVGQAIIGFIFSVAGRVVIARLQRNTTHKTATARSFLF